MDVKNHSFNRSKNGKVVSELRERQGGFLVNKTLKAQTIMHRLSEFHDIKIKKLCLKKKKRGRGPIKSRLIGLRFFFKV